MAAYTDNWWRRVRDGMPPVAICALALGIALMVPLLLLRVPMLLVVGAGLGVVGLGLIVACPYIGLLLFLALLYLRPEELWPALGGARLTLMVSLIAMFAWLINGLLVRERFRMHLPAVQSLLVFVVVAIGSTLISGSGTLGEIAIELLKLLVLFVLMAHLLTSEKRVHGAMVALVLFTAVLGARTIWRFQHGEALVQSDGAVRAIGTGIFSDPNDLSLAMAMALPMALGIGLGLGRAVAHQGWLSRIVGLGCVPIYVWTVFVSDSRGGMLALATALFLYFRRRLGRAGLVLGTMAVLVLFTLGPARMSNLSADEESAAGRVDAWIAGIHMLISSPVWGVGKGQFTEHNHLTAHNSFVLCFAELGVVGAMAWMGLFYFVFRDGKILARERQLSALGSRLSVDGAAPPRFDSSRSDTTSREPRAESRERERERSDPWSRSALAQISLITFAVGGFFLSRTYTPPLYVYLALALAATHAEAETAGVPLPPATSKDLAWVAGLAIGGIVGIWLLIRVLG